MPSSTASRWCFTLNNYTTLDEAHVGQFFARADITYGVYGRETGSSGTPHLQGFVILRSPQRRSFLQRHMSNRAHYEQARGTSQQASDYCKKDGDFTENGTLPTRQGNRTDLQECIDWIDEFTREHGRAPTSPDIAKHQPHAYVKYARIRSLAAHRAPRRALEFGEPKPWQQLLKDELDNDADDRTVRFIVDENGGQGKTWFCRWMLTNNDNVQVLGIGKNRIWLTWWMKRNTYFSLTLAADRWNSYPTHSWKLSRIVY